ncbi:DMT family transporter [Methylobacterium nigriterrae]|uniref:DMT family transporter n=1 Tax=Methylobacterium nigriterrae TaxID=3127512 RepID=UPI003013A970
MARLQPTPTGSDEIASRPVTGAYVFLTLTALIWAGNAVAGKWAVGQVSPFALTSLRWLVACAALVPLAGRQVAREWRLLLPSWRRILLMGGCGYTAFNALFYVAGTYTSATNLALFQGAIPVVVLACSFAVYRTPIGWIQAVGVLVTLLGVAVAATHGDWQILRTLDFNRGDLLMLVACLLYAGYTVALRGRPAVSGLTFFTAMAAAALLTSLPLLMVEWGTGRLVWPTGQGWAIVVFVGLGPSLISQLFFMRGVEMIGPNRAGVFVNLVPVFGAFLAVALVGEPFRPDNAAALALVLGGIFIAERFGRRSQAS